MSDASLRQGASLAPRSAAEVFTTLPEAVLALAEDEATYVPGTTW
jgi:hypothetical protein